MSTETLRFIAQTKLRELQQQRTLLVDAYERLAQEMAPLPPVEKLRKLYLGLRDVKLGWKFLHPEVNNLEILFAESGPSDEVLALWQQRLEKELHWGRLRAEIVYLFGALLEEWGKQPDEMALFRHEREQALQHLLHVLTQPAEPQGDFLQALPDPFADLRASVPGRYARAAERYLASESAAFGLEQVPKNIYFSPALRAEARRFVDNGILGGELSTSLALATRSPDSWNWPEEGVPVQVLWTRNKWRLYPRLTLTQLGIIETYGSKLMRLFDEVFTSLPQLLHRKERLQKLIEVHAPPVIMENEQRMLRKAQENVRIHWYETVDPWTGRAVDDWPANSDGGVVAVRALKMSDLRRSSAAGYYEYAGGSLQVQLMHAEVRTLRAAYPDRPLFLVKLDIQDYYPSVPHEVVLGMLRRFELPREWLELCGRFLAVPMQISEGVHRARRGLPMNHALSGFLAETLMLLLEEHVHRQASVRIVRVVDDLCLLAPSAEEIVQGFRAVEQFLAGCGLKLNREKCGALALGAGVPPGLPEGTLRWGLLELRADGGWGVHEGSFQAHLDQSRERLQGTRSILEKVSAYNANLRFLLSSAGMQLDLGDAHRESLNAALRRFHGDFFGPGASIVEGLRNTIAARWARAGSTLPESWLYWPITAGGLSLQNVTVLIGQYHENLKARREQRVPPPERRTDDWQFDKDWTAYYRDAFETLKPLGPRETTVMRTLVEDFIRRGKEISAGKQQDLAPYWRWLLVVYGPQILEEFGSFRFLLTDLVPLQLIHERLLHDSSLGAGEPAADGAAAGVEAPAAMKG